MHPPTPPEPVDATNKELYGFHFNQFINEESNFQPKDGHFAAEIIESDDGNCELLETELFHDEISAWLHQKDTDKSKTRLRLLQFTPRENYKSLRPYPVSSSTFKDIFDTLNIPPIFLRVSLANLPIAMRFRPGSHGRTRRDNKPIGFIFRSDGFSFAQYSLALVYDPETNCTTAVSMGLRREEYEQFLKYLKGTLQAVNNYMLLPLTLVDFMNHMTARWLTYNRMSLLAIANSKDISIREAGDDRGFISDRGLDLDTATKKLTFLNDEFSITESISKTQLRFLDLIDEALSEQSKISDPDWKGASEIDMFLDHTAFLRESFKSALQYIERDRHNINGLAQTTYCLIAQKESRNNLAIADASRRISDESRKVAMLTRRDSTDMRIITAITLIFLPGTFTATLLGSNFFNFKPAEDTRVTSPWFWVYCVVTILLTILVLLVWIIVSRIQRKRANRKLKAGDRADGVDEPSAPSYALTGFWTSRGASAIWSERVIRAEEPKTAIAHVHRDLSRQAGCEGGGCGGGCGGGDGGCGGCGGGCGS